MLFKVIYSKNTGGYKMAKKKNQPKPTPNQKIFIICPRCGNRVEEEQGKKFNGCCSKSCQAFMDKATKPTDDQIPVENLE